MFCLYCRKRIIFRKVVLGGYFLKIDVHDCKSSRSTRARQRCYANDNDDRRHTFEKYAAKG